MSKRKASTMDDEDVVGTPGSLLPPSSQSSTATCHTAPLSLPTTYTDTHTAHLNPWNIAGAPYFNSRTRKRFRDRRPDDATIHQHTLNKLYDAQKVQQTGTTGSRGINSHVTNAETSPDTPRHPRYHLAAQVINGPVNRVEVPVEPSQRRLDAFLGERNTNRSSVSQEPSTTAVFAPPLVSSRYQPDESAPTIIPSHPTTLPSILTCEDCYGPLLTKHSNEVIDAEMLDVDGLLENLVDPEVEGGWTCAVCAKRVCDVCAVRGDYRVCLECAVPGGGRYQETELREKRWIGGIGWM